MRGVGDTREKLRGDLLLGIRWVDEKKKRGSGPLKEKKSRVLSRWGGMGGGPVSYMVGREFKRWKRPTNKCIRRSKRKTQGEGGAEKDRGADVVEGGGEGGGTVQKRKKSSSEQKETLRPLRAGGGRMGANTKRGRDLTVPSKKKRMGGTEGEKTVSGYRCF